MHKKLSPAPHRLLPLGALAAALLLAGCADMGGIAPHVQPRQASSLGLAEPPSDASELQSTAWWRGFGDAQLTALVEQALQDNPSLGQAQARIEQAQALADATGATAGPQLSASTSATRQHYSANGPYPPGQAGASISMLSARLSGSWELDFFGQHRAALAAALGQVQAARAEADAARLLLASQVAQQYFELARLQAQRAVAERGLAQREHMLHLVQGRVAAGLDTQLELRQSEGALPQTRQQIEALREREAITRNAIGALVANPAMAQALTPPQLDAITPLAIAEQLPADLLGRRPDVAAARWRVQASTDNVAAARAQFYPNVSLTSFVGLASMGLDNLLQGSSREWGLGPALRLPIFDSGRLRANLRGRAAEQDAAVHSYNAALGEALRDAADQLASRQAIARQQAEQQDASRAAEDAWRIAERRYEAGLGNYLQVLSAETQVLQQRRQAVDLRARQLANQASLLRALGGQAA